MSGNVDAWTSCYVCSAPIWMQREQLDNLRATGATFSCPFGHKQAFIIEERVPKALLDEERESASMFRDQRDELGDKLHEARKTARTCPLCDFTFRSRGHVAGHLLERHGASIHGYERDDAGAIEAHAEALRARVDMLRQRASR